MSKELPEVNGDVLRQCREQMGLSLEQAIQRTRIKSLAEMEGRCEEPTYDQLEKLSDVYQVTSPTFRSDKLPEECIINSLPVFRSFPNREDPMFYDYNIRTLLLHIDGLRELVIELRQDQDEPLEEFSSPDVSADAPDLAAQKIRQWLNTSDDESCTFSEWREDVESKGILVYMAGKDSQWPKVNKKLRGFAVWNKKVPIIIINNSTAKKTQSFTLLHALGHILRQESIIDCANEAGKDSHGSQANETEGWCDKFARSCLNPPAPSSAKAQRNRAKSTRPKRYGPKNIIPEYGWLASNAIIQAYYDNEVTLHKMCLMFGRKNYNDALRIVTK